MEHKVLLGGGYEYLPFARSRIKALKALGMPYADQSFKVGDVSIAVRVEPGHEYIRIEGGVIELEMDSGVVDVLATGANAVDRYKPGIMFMPSFVTGYTSRYSVPGPPETDKRLEGYRTYESKDANTQLVGFLKVNKPKIKGHVLPDRSDAKSFSPQALNTESDDDALLGKKRAVSTIPASMFTGRCRLYVQAMYGAALYTYNRGMTKVVSTNVPFTVDMGSGTPKLLVTSYVSKSDVREVDGVVEQNTYPTIHISALSGVYKDVRGRDWLIQFEGAGNVYAYPLVARKPADALWSMTADGYTDLTTESKRKLETFLLSVSLPDTKNKILVSGNVPDWFGHGGTSGYGWHWNHKGTQAVCTENSTTVVDVDVLVMSSSTVMIDVSNTYTTLEDGTEVITFALTATTLERESRWGVKRSQYCITYPNFTYGGCTKLTPHGMEFYAGVATFYSYFLGDVLTLCTISVTKVPEANHRIMTSNYMESDTPGSVGVSPHLTLGLADGWYEDHLVGEHFTVSISVGARSLSGVSGYIDEITYHKTYGKSIIGGQPSSSAVYGNYQYYVGSASLTASRQNSITPQFGYIEPPAYSQDYAHKINATIEFGTKKVYRTGYAVCAIASYDAECVYLYEGTNEDIEVHAQQANGNLFGGWMGGTILSTGTISPCYLWYDLYWGFLSTETTGEIPINTMDRIYVNSCSIIGHGSSTGARFTRDDAEEILFGGPIDEVSELFFSLSGFNVGGDATTLTSWAPQVVSSDPLGSGLDDGTIRSIKMPTFVGWI